MEVQTARRLEKWLTGQRPQSRYGEPPHPLCAVRFGPAAAAQFPWDPGEDLQEALKGGTYRVPSTRFPSTRHAFTLGEGLLVLGSLCALELWLQLWSGGRGFGGARP